MSTANEVPLGVIEKLKKYFEYDFEEGVLYRTAIDTRWGIRQVKRRRAGWINHSGYLRIDNGGAEYFVHRVIWAFVHGYWPDVIDHIDGNKLNNKISNLRDCNQSINIRNSKLRINNKTGYTGVIPFRGKFKAEITHYYVNEHLGVFNTAEEAHLAYQQRKLEIVNGQ